MLQIPEIVKKTEETFDLFNEHFYNKKLTRPAITVSPDGGRGADGNVINLTAENDAFYQETKQRTGEYFDKLDVLGLLKEAKLLIDRYVSENMANVSRYGELAYKFQLKLTRCMILLIGIQALQKMRHRYCTR